MSSDEVRDGVSLTNLDQPLFDGAEATKRDLVDYLDAVHDRIIPVLRDRPLSVISQWPSIPSPAKPAPRRARAPAPVDPRAGARACDGRLPCG